MRRAWAAWCVLTAGRIVCGNAPRQHKHKKATNWAPGYRTAGEADAGGGGEDTWESYDRSFVAPEGWERQSYKYSAPDAYLGSYAARRDACEWSAPEDIFSHTRRYLSGAYGGAFNRSRWKSKNMYNQWSQYLLNASVCRVSRVDGATGDAWDTYVTRVGPITLNPSKLINDFFVPAGPTAASTAFLVEAVDGYLDAALRPLPYPPVHPHHSSTLIVGYPEAIGYASPGSPFFGFNPIAVLPEAALAEGGGEWIQTSTNTPGFNGDFYGCRGDLDDMATPCYYVKLPSGTGFPKYAGVDFWSNSVLEHVPPGGPVRLFYEYGRTWVTPRDPSTYAPLFVLDFAIGGDGALYDVHGDSVAWFTYAMPVGGTFRSSWYHTHAVAPSDFWVLDAHAADVLPRALLDACGGACSTRNQIGINHPTWRSNNSGVVAADVPLAPLGLSTDGLMRDLLDAHRDRLRCWYRSRHAYSKRADRFYGRSYLRHANFTTCDGWTFAPGQLVTLVAFNGAVPTQTFNAIPAKIRQRGVFPQHQRWFPTAELDFDFQAHFPS